MAKRKKARRRKWRWLRYRKNDLAHNVQVAVQRWIHANGGTAVVIGGIGILDERDPFSPSPAGNYRVCVSALGIVPQKKEKAQSPASNKAKHRPNVS